MNIRNAENYINSFWDWSFLSGTLCNRCLPSDIDGIYEKNHQILILETKGIGATLSGGQSILLDHLQDLEYRGHKAVTVMLIRGVKNKPESITIIHRNGTKSEILNANVDILWGLVKQWAKWAMNFKYS
jgi:hypothetical protein